MLIAGLAVGREHAREHARKLDSSLTEREPRYSAAR
jgi:hypothetical protein